MTRIIELIRHPRAAVILHDFCMIVVAWFAAAWLMESTSAHPLGNNISTMTGLFIVLVLQGSVLWATGLYKGLWRFASFPDLWNIARAATFGTILIITTLTIFYGAESRHAACIGPLISGVTGGRTSLLCRSNALHSRLRDG